MNRDRGATRERPLLFTLATGSLALALSAAMLWWAYAAPEDVVIGLPGRHDAVGQTARLADCLDCHVPFVGTPGTRCLGPGCHGDLATGTPPRDGPAMPIRFHAALAEHECSRCHFEHAPRKTAVPLRFDHAVIPSDTRGRCAHCHVAERAAHARTDAVSCDLCHGFDEWKGAAMIHERVQNHACDLCHAAPNTEAHASVAGACNDCHQSARWVTAPD